MRDAISMLDKCLSYNSTLTIENVVKALGISDYENLNNLLTYLVTSSDKCCIDIIEKIYKSGKDLKQFIKQQIQFVLDVCKYLIYESYDYIQIPNNVELNAYRDVEYEQLLNILDEMINLSNNIKYESNPKVLIEATILLICKGER